MDTASESFGCRLKSQRERRGIGLEAIAASTKIKRSLLADLERGDASKWPAGIFRRAFVREYAASIGLAPEPVVAEFVRLFPDEEQGDPPLRDQPADLRLTLADGGRAPLSRIAIHLATAFLEMSVILALARTVTWVSGSSFWTVCGAASFTYYAVASAICGSTPALWWLNNARQLRAARYEGVRTNARELLNLLVRQASHRSAISSHAAATEDLHPSSGLILPS